MARICCNLLKTSKIIYKIDLTCNNKVKLGITYITVQYNTLLLLVDKCKKLLCTFFIIIQTIHCQNAKPLHLELLEDDINALFNYCNVYYYFLCFIFYYTGQ